MSATLEASPELTEVRPKTASEGPWGKVLLVVGVLAALVYGISLWNVVVQDDTYISLIYSRNLARGEGLLYNPGHEAVEGYTNFSWTVLSGGAIALGWDPVVFVQVAGLACALAVVVLTYLLARRIGASELFAGVAAVVMGVRPALALEAMGGLETCFFAMLVQTAVWLTLSPNPRTSTRVGASVLLGLSALTRPEGVFVFGLLELSHLFLAWRDRRSSDRPLVEWLRTGLPRWLPFVLIVGTHLTFRWLTYHDYVPNTARAKVHSDSLRIFERGFDYVFRGIAFYGPVFFFLPYLVRKLITGKGAGVLLFVNAVYVTYIFYVGGDFKLTWRFFVVLFPIWCALAACSFDALATRLSGTWPRARGAFATLMLVFMSTQLVWEILKAPDTDIRGMVHARLCAAGKYLNGVLPEGAWIASTNAGCIPYFADRLTLDMMGLSDKHIARVPVKAIAQDKTGHERGDGKYVLDQEPDVILLIRGEFTPVPANRMAGGLEIMKRNAIGTSEREIVQDPRFDRDYELVSVPLEEIGGYFNYFRRRNGR